MADVINRGSLLPPQVVADMFNKVGGHSALANLSNQMPIPFNGAQIMTFALDKEADIVAESGAKTKGGATVSSVTITPVKFEYGARVSDEFLYGSEEYKLNVLQQFADGAAKKFARGFDLAGFHGINPRTGTASAVVGTNNFDSAVAAANKVTYVAASADANIETAIALVEAADAELNGIAMDPAMRSALAALTANGARKYPEFAFGGNPGLLGGMKIDVNNTVKGTSTGLDRAILGDFQNAFKWGYAKDIPLEVIQYGNPDNDATLGDLKGHNQVYLRCEAYIGWGILDASRFAIVAAASN